MATVDHPSNSNDKLVVLLDRLPTVDGTLRILSLSKLTWFRVGGNAIVFSPKDEDDLINFLKNTPADIDIIALGLGSNILLRDGGFNGVIIRTNALSSVYVNDLTITAGAGAMDSNIAKTACENSIDNFAFLSGIPGSIGGALSMNAGAYGTEIKDIFVRATGVTRSGDKKTYSLSDMGFGYRHCSVKDVFFTSATLTSTAGDKKIIQKQIDDISIARTGSQPVKQRTGGSTFRNPTDSVNGELFSAWKLLDKAGLRGKTIGGAMISDQHCNFLINTGTATAKDLEQLGNLAQAIVKEKFGVNLIWEIKRIGNFK